MEVVEGVAKLGKRNMMEKCYIGMLGADQVIGILQYLPVKSVVAFGMTCSKFRELTQLDAVWAWICRREWGPWAVDAVAGHKVTWNWKQLYRQMHAIDSVFCRQLTQKGEATPSPRASHSLNVVSGALVLFGGGCEGGPSHVNIHYFFTLPFYYSLLIIIILNDRGEWVNIFLIQFNYAIRKAKLKLDIGNKMQWGCEF